MRGSLRTHSRFIRFAPVLLLCLGSLLLLSYVGFAETGRIYSKLRCDRVATLVEIAAAPEWSVLGEEKIAGLLRLADSAIFSVDVLDAVPPERGDAMAAGACHARAPRARGGRRPWRRGLPKPRDHSRGGRGSADFPSEPTGGCSTPLCVTASSRCCWWSSPRHLPSSWFRSAAVPIMSAGGGAVWWSRQG